MRYYDFYILLVSIFWYFWRIFISILQKILIWNFSWVCLGFFGVFARFQWQASYNKLAVAFPFFLFSDRVVHIIFFLNIWEIAPMKPFRSGYFSMRKFLITCLFLKCFKFIFNYIIDIKIHYCKNSKYYR